MKIPPGVSAGDFAEAIKQFEEAVGKEWVFTSDEDVAMYRDAYSPFWGEEEELVASAAVAPDNVEQVQKIVRIANSLQNSALPESHRQKSRLWRLRARSIPAAWCST